MIVRMVLILYCPETLLSTLSRVGGHGYAYSSGETHVYRPRQYEYLADLEAEIMSDLPADRQSDGDDGASG